MKLVADWRWVLKRAWSIRPMIPAGTLSGLEMIFSLSDVADRLDYPPRLGSISGSKAPGLARRSISAHSAV